MRIRVVEPILKPGGRTEEESLEELTRRVHRALQAGTQLSLRYLRAGPASIECFVDEAVAVPYILEEVLSAQREGHQAVVIDCFGDPGVSAARELAQILVIGAGQAAMTLGAVLGESFSVVTVLEKVVPLIRRNARLYGLSDRMVSVRWVDVPVLELEGNPEVVFQKIVREGKVAVEKEGAEVIVLGCTGFSPLAEKLRDELLVPVVDPTLAAIKLAEALVLRGWSHSKAAFPPPLRRQAVGFPGLISSAD